MRIEHLALWTEDLDRLIGFYIKYFDAQAGNRYRNTTTGFVSCFLSFDSGTRIEVMHLTGKSLEANPREKQRIGLAHFALAVGSEQTVDGMTASIEQDGFKVLSAPCRTGDGYYESVALDPDGNRVEITVGGG